MNRVSFNLGNAIALLAASAISLFAVRGMASTPAMGPLTPSSVSAASAGAQHACAIDTLGALRCWGGNAEGQLGDGTNTHRAVPVMPSLPPVSKVASGSAHTCTLSAGTVYCWGRNTSGQLGDGTTASRNTPVSVAGLGYALSLAAGHDHTCVVTTQGVRCWGRNNFGQLGDGTTVDRATPVPVPGFANGLSAGAGHTCAFQSGGGVRCWGRNVEGQLGDGTTVNRLSPVDVQEGQLLSGVIDLASGGYHNCVADVLGGVKCWGYNIYGQIGDGTTVNRTIPSYPINLGVGMAGVSAGLYHSCAVTRTGKAQCWGGNIDGVLGDGTVVQRVEPVDVTGLGTGVQALFGGGNLSCALTHLNGLLCWGRNDLGQLGDGSNTDRVNPVEVAGLSGVATIKAGAQHTCSITADGKLVCWGRNADGQLGDGTTAGRAAPQPLIGYAGTVLTAGAHFNCTLFSCWGSNAGGQFGNGNTTGAAVPTYQPQFQDVADIGGGEFHACSVSKFGTVKCWGSNSFGQLGDGTLTQRLEPVTVSGLASGVSAIAVGRYHACALTSAGGVKCWGTNTSGQLGNGTTANSNVPVNVTGLASGVIGLATSTASSCALMATGGVKCWGGAGQAGDGSFTQRNTPVDVMGLASGVLGLAGGNAHMCARTSAGTVKCWGNNANGQLGDGTTLSRTSPVDVAGIPTGVASIAGGNSHACALFHSGAVQCWGHNADGQLGDLTTTQRLTPVHALATLNVTRSGASGAVTSFPSAISCGASCTANVRFGEQIRLVATAGAAAQFNGWSGGLCYGSGDCYLKPYGTTSVGADFLAVAALDPALPDFNADNRPDILWRHTPSGALYVWYMNGVTLTSDQLVTTVDPSWKMDGVADFNGDGHPDIVWRNGAGDTYVWYLVNGVFQSDAFLFSLPPEWVIQGVADFNADGKPDFLMRNTNSGNAFAWFFNNNVAIGDQFLFNIDPSWKVEGVGDFNADAQPDLLFRNTVSGLAFAWNTQWATSTLSLTTSSPSIFSIDATWEVVQVADWNADGKPDLLFRNRNSGVVFVWYMDGTTLTTSDFIIQIDPVWEIVPRR